MNLSSLPPLESCRIAVIGLGYVGLPLSVLFASEKRCSRSDKQLHRSVVGYDINSARVSQLNSFTDVTKEVDEETLSLCENITFTHSSELLCDCDVFIVAVPTPTDDANRPDMKALLDASKTVALAIQSRHKEASNNCPVVIYESTVYPGATEEICIPLLEQISGLILNQGFYVGYSPERVNPGDNSMKIKDIRKITSGSSNDAAEWIDNLYGSVISSGTFKASCIRVAEAAKVVENTQRDLNIALINELALLFAKLGLDTRDVIEAASTKWNFMPFYPGLVGGHCIGVDPYYLTHKAEQVGYHPQVILAGRRINSQMHEWVGQELLRQLVIRGCVNEKPKVLMLGLTFKENCPDIRNAKTIELVKFLTDHGLDVIVVDPIVDIRTAEQASMTQVYKEIPGNESFDIIVGAVAHDYFLSFTTDIWEKLTNNRPFVFDIKGFIPRQYVGQRL